MLSDLVERTQVESSTVMGVGKSPCGFLRVRKWEGMGRVG